jgi:hypothetical protein
MFNRSIITKPVDTLERLAEPAAVGVRARALTRPAASPEPRRLPAKALSEQPATPLELVFDPDGDTLEAARACEAEVFLRAYGNTVEDLDLEYGPYEDTSVFMALTANDGGVVAACRLITPGEAGLKTINDTGRAPWGVDGTRSARAARIDLSRTWDVATIGVRADAGHSRIFAAAALYHGIAVAAQVNRIQTVVMIMDERARRLLTALGVVTQPLPGTHTAPYLGSPASTPLYGNLVQMTDLQRRVNPEAHRLIGQGIGLDGVSVPEPAAFRLRARPRAVLTSGAMA